MINFRNAVSLTGEWFNSFKIGGKPFKILAMPSLEYLDTLLESAEEEDVELATVQVNLLYS